MIEGAARHQALPLRGKPEEVHVLKEQRWLTERRWKARMELQLRGPALPLKLPGKVAEEQRIEKGALTNPEITAAKIRPPATINDCR